MYAIRSYYELKATYQHDFVIVTTNNAGGKSSREYADDYYDDNNFGIGAEKSGFLLIIDMDNSEAYISTRGEAIDYLTNARLNVTLDKIVNELKGEFYFLASQVFLDDMSLYLTEGIPENQYRYDEETGDIIPEGGDDFPGNGDIIADSETPKKEMTTGAVVLISLVAGGIFVLVVRVKYSFKSPAPAYPLKENSSLNLTKREDIFINKTLTHYTIQDSSGGNSGGGSSTHTSSSGTTHGGGGKGF